METYREFLDRINSFQHKELNLGNDNFQVNTGVLKKVDSNNTFSCFYGDTVVFDLDSTSKNKISRIVNDLYKYAEDCFCEKIVSNTFHMTLHDLNNSPVFEEVSEDMLKTEATLREKIKNSTVQKQTIRMKTKCIFNMVNTSIVLGLYPADETEYTRLMELYNIVDDIKSLPYPLTPHITLAYYNRNGFSQENCRKLESIVNRLNKDEFEITLSTDRLVYQFFSSMNNYTSIFSFT